jgi:hypothetical protein
MTRKTYRRARIGVETLEGRALLTGGNLLPAAQPAAAILPPSAPNIVGDKFVVTDGIYDYVGTLWVTAENTATGRFSGLYIDRQLNHIGVWMTVTGNLTRDTGFYDFSFSGGGSLVLPGPGGTVEFESQTVTFGGSLDLSDYSLPMVGILDVHDTFSWAGYTWTSDTGPIAVGGRIPRPVPDVNGQTFAIENAGFQPIGRLVITSEDQSSDTFTGYYVDSLHNELGVVQAVHGVIVPNPDPRGPIGFQFEGSGSASAGFPLPEYEHQYVTFVGTIEGGGNSATISGTMDLHDEFDFLWRSTYDSGDMQVIGLS